MPKITYVSVDGCEHIVDAEVGESVMAAAVKSGVPGIVAECGGNASCATCHVYVRDEFLALVGPTNDLEDDMLDLAVSERRGTSRLSCQIEVRHDFDGLAVDVPPEQP